jgi:hypothetical protein
VLDNNDDEAAFGTIACAICRTREALWVHALDPQLAQFQVSGDGHIWGSPLILCGRCDQSLRAADVEALVEADPSSSELHGRDLDERVGNGMRALVAADLGATPIDESRPPGYGDLVDAGFTPLENITGALFLADAWPDSDRCALLSISPDNSQGLHDDHHWFIRSPWPSIPLSDVFGLVINVLDEALRDMEPHYDEEQANTHVRELLTSSEEDIHCRLNT